MTDTQHTPGPWTVAEDDINGQAIVRGRHTEIATCWHHCLGSLEIQMRANARLIAAAPEMWDLIVELFEDPKLSLIIGGNPNRVGALMERADKLRAKVRGTQ
jgi:hypothetical protein